MLVRDSRDRDGGTLTFAPTVWTSFVEAVPAADSVRTTRR
ncbi:DUF397 domain-containing protein [Micromonospora sp. NBC_00330]|nr:DUF397 domain-containing protein [Micromonospora sp. NBC_00330]